MSLAPTIRTRLTVESGRVRDVALRPQEPSPAQALFVGLSAREVPARAAMIFSLCPIAQSVAAELAIGAAHGATPVLDRKRRAALVSEHLAENLRSLVLAWSDAQPDVATLASLRTALDALRGLPDSVDADRRRRILILREVTATLGLALHDDTPATWLQRLLQVISRDPLLASRVVPAPVTLDPEEDEAIFACLQGKAHSASLSKAQVSIDSHLRARGAAIVTMIDRLASIASGEDGSGMPRARPLGMNKGAAAVDSPRGRLFHYVELNDDDRVLSYRTLSPTDRNFARGGPFEQALLSSDIGAGPAAKQAVARIAALYDPCVAVEVKIVESADA